MGLIHPDRHDIFVSYAHGDDTLYGGYVSRFRDELQRRLTPAIRAIRDPEPGREADVFIDEWGLPGNGELNAGLEEAVGRAELLFVFVGRLYLKSVYCGKELGWFRNRFNGVVKTALERTFIIVLEEMALEGARREFGSADTEPIVQPFYDRQSKKPLGLTQQDENKEFERRFQRLLDDVAERVAALMAAEAPAPKTPPLAEHDSRIMIGIVPPRLEAVREALDERLRASGIGVYLLGRDELARNPDSVRSRAGEARFFVQPFDLGEVEAERRDAAGGHLSRQTKLLAPTGIETRWWLVPAAGLADGDEPPERDPAHVAYLNEIAAHADNRSLDDFVSQLLDDLNPRDRICRVLIEYTPADALSTTLLGNFRALLRDRWTARNRAGCLLGLDRADWANIRSDRTWHYNYHGFIIIDRSKTLSALGTQVSDIDSLLLGAKRQLVRGLFTLPPKEGHTLEPDKVFWPALILFRLGPGDALTLDTDGEEQLQRFFEGVHQVACGESELAEAFLEPSWR